MKVGDLYKVVPAITSSSSSRDPSQLGDLVVIDHVFHRSPTVIAINLLTGQKRYYSSKELREVMSEGGG